jgi:hypothetical protein
VGRTRPGEGRGVYQSESARRRNDHVPSRPYARRSLIAIHAPDPARTQHRAVGPGLLVAARASFGGVVTFEPGGGGTRLPPPHCSGFSVGRSWARGCRYELSVQPKVTLGGVERSSPRKTRETRSQAHEIQPDETATGDVIFDLPARVLAKVRRRGAILAVVNFGDDLNTAHVGGAVVLGPVSG